MSDLLKGRRNTRVNFQYPVEFKLVSPNLLSRDFTGHIRDLSMEGACIQFVDQYGRFNMIEPQGVEIELKINLSGAKSFCLPAAISWFRRVDNEDDYSLIMGLEFKELSEDQIEQLDQFFSLKDQDQIMMWNLCDYYIQNETK